MLTVNVALGERSYPIYIGEHLLGNAELIAPHLCGHQVLVVSNQNIADLYMAPLRASLSKYQCDLLLLPAGEEHKNLSSINSIFDALLQQRHQRTTTLVALGGGVIGDMTGFAAACYQRGVGFIQIPTTLLAQVDSSVGGKTGVNHPLGKNMIGAFHQPQCVIIDVATLQSLPEREFNAGLAEVIKYGLICDEAFFAWLESNMTLLLSRQLPALSYAIQRSCEIKAEIVAYDETERGRRALLNFGHTFGHAIENTLGYGVWLHGEAVALGMVMAAKLSEAMNWLSSAETKRIQKILQQAKLPISVPSHLMLKKMSESILLDKKVINNVLRFVLLKKIGEAVITSDVPDDWLQKASIDFQKNA